MIEITKLSELTPEYLAEYLRMPEPEESDLTFLKNSLLIAKDFVVNYTGQTLEELDKRVNICWAVQILCQDMYDTRTLYIEKKELNSAVKQILSLNREVTF